MEHGQKDSCGNRAISVQDSVPKSKGAEHCSVFMMTDDKSPMQQNDGLILVKDENEPKKEDCVFALKEQYWQWVVVKEKEKPKDHHVIFAKPESRTSSNVLTVCSMFELEVPKEFFAPKHVLTGVFNRDYIYDNELKFVLKWLKRSHNCHVNGHIKNKIAASETTAKIISSFNELLDMGGWRIRVVETLLMEGGHEEMGIEPYVACDEWFSWNTFLEPGTFRIHRKLVIALIHYSYVYSGGCFVLSNVKGEVDEGGMVVTLLTPDLVSAKQGNLGCQDLGTLRQFEKYHTCNTICLSAFA